MAKKNTKTETKNTASVGTVKKIGSRGRTFEGFVTKVFPSRVVIEFTRTVYIPKFERYAKKKTRVHARLPEGMNIKTGDYIQLRECRPLSKLIHSLS
jgi:small subunit ribosomal protein S17